ncbi:MAG TPA: TerB family tellurite resistance protein [Myxococcota bacterium]|nr:TerB family tellurite resistance protein [Myxococcota bacterium]HQK49712.1 TerB family tellurite resistance protein [Myxococcota bacterium]
MAIHRPSPMQFTHSLAYLYLFLAHHGDREGLTRPELDTLIAKVREWNDQFSPNARASLETTLAEVQQTVDYFVALTQEEEMSELALHTAALQSFLPEQRHKIAVMKDMVAIAEADGRVTDAEKSIIAAVYQGLGLS